MSRTTTEFELASKGSAATLAVLRRPGRGYAAIPNADGVNHSCNVMGAGARCA